MLLEYTNYEIVKLVLTVRNCILEYQHIWYGALTTQKENLNASSVQAVIKLIWIQEIWIGIWRKIYVMAEELMADSDQKIQDIHKYFICIPRYVTSIWNECFHMRNPGLFQNNLCKFDQIWELPEYTNCEIVKLGGQSISFLVYQGY